MALLDVFKDVLLDALEVIFSEGLIWHVPQVDNGKGGYTAGVPTSQSCLVFEGEVTQDQRKEEGYTDKDVGLFVLQSPGLTLDADDEVEVVGGTRYVLGKIVSDPAKATWQVRGTPKHG